MLQLMLNRRLKPLDDLYVLWIATLTVYSRILQQPFHPSTFPAQISSAFIISHLSFLKLVFDFISFLLFRITFTQFLRTFHNNLE